MDYKFSDLRDELKNYYWYQADTRAKAFCQKCVRILDDKAALKPGMSVYEQKVLQYQTITEEFDPVLFYHSPFYYETGTMAAHCDGARDFHGHSHAGGWVYWRNAHLFADQNKTLWKKRCRQGDELFYLICGPYNDVSQHFPFYYRPIFRIGLKGIYEKAADLLPNAETDEQKAFLQAVCDGMLCLKKIGEKFAHKADMLLEALENQSPCTDSRCDSAFSSDTRQTVLTNLRRIADTAGRTPWEAPKNFYEALNTYAFMRKILGSLEGVGFNTFGRVDMDLYPFYQRDIAEGRLTSEEAYALICRFLITFDTHYDHDMKAVGYGEHELENTYVVGGCDADGKPFYNELTQMFLRAAREEKIIFPKIKCRFSANSPKEYLDEINQSVINGTSTVLYSNDDAVIPALIRAGRTLEEARDYLITGCWGMMCNGIEKPDNGGYVNLLKPFEYSLHKLTDKMDYVGMHFRPIDDAQNFEEVYQITCDNIRVLMEERSSITLQGGNIWNQVDVLPLFSSTLESCLDQKTDYTAGGAKYRDDQYMCFGLPNIVDSLLAIKTLCFDTGRYTLAQLLAAVRKNWEGAEDMRRAAMVCPGWGDGSTASCILAARFNHDLYSMTNQLTGTYGGKVQMGHLTFTEIRFWGEKTLAMPDGRRNGEYFAQGLTPSRLKVIPSVTNVINSLKCLDPSIMAGNSVVNIILPMKRITADVCEALLRTAADSALQSLQLNCIDKEQLLDAQKHPENYPDLIIRVCGFSARFTSLSPEWQQEVLTRNFYE